MAYLRIDKAVFSATVFQTMIGLLKRLISRPEKADVEPAIRVTDAEALEAFSRLSDQHLGDIGIYRKVRRVEWDTLARPLLPEKTVTFDYFRLDG
ncbi:hypothetical protein [Rhizobium sp. 1399]|uniref:hypothetical protein n=1 Tax=Rhizobium sp. 1399 TaxID=2817758 RepID=UPI002859F201|nr:hypothetical protein [Rhizobium sp. 1399]MDR6670292.1 hypothetical protein [Rhizobium sp. 1399]